MIAVSDRAWLRSWRSALQGRRAITVGGTICAVVIAFLSTVTYEIPRLYLSRDDHPLSWTIAEASVGSIALLVGWLVLRATGGRHRLAVVVGSYLGFGVLRWATIQLQPWLEPGATNVVDQLILSCLLAVLALSIPAVCWDQLDRYRAGSRELTEQAYALERKAKELEGTRRDVARSVRVAIDDRIRPALRGFAESIRAEADRLRAAGAVGATGATGAAGAGHARIDALSRQLRGYAQSSVRALSHDLVAAVGARESAPPPALPVPDEVVAHFRSTRPTFIRSRPFAPGLFLLLAGFFLSVAAVGGFGWVRGFGGALVACAGSTLVLAVADRWLTRRLRDGELKPALAWIVGVYALASFAAAMLPLQIYNPDLVHEYWPVWGAVAFVAAMVFCAVAGGLGGIGYLTALQSDLRAQSSTYQWAIDREQFVLDQIAAKIAETLHTYVQGRLMAAAANLNLSTQQAEAGTLPTAGLVEALSHSATDLAATARTLTAQGLLDTGHGRQTPGVTAGVDAVAAAWRGVVSVEIDCDPADLDLINSDPVAADLAVWIVQELVSNAFRHGEASQLWIRIWTERSTVHVAGADDGLGIAADLRPGMGLVGLARAGVVVELGARPGGGAVVGTRFDMAGADMAGPDMTGPDMTGDGITGAAAPS